jgi:hypothetical protein
MQRLARLVVSLKVAEHDPGTFPLLQREEGFVDYRGAVMDDLAEAWDHATRCKDKGLNRPARYRNSHSGLTIRSGDNPTSTVAASCIGRMGGWVP